MFIPFLPPPSPLQSGTHLETLSSVSTLCQESAILLGSAGCKRRHMAAITVEHTLERSARLHCSNVRAPFFPPLFNYYDI